MSSYKKNIGANIRYERTIRNMSIDELAEMLHLSTAFIGLIERGQRGAKLSNLIKISEIFGITVNDLIYNTHNEPMEVREDNDAVLKEAKKTTIKSLLYDLDANELDFVISAIRSLRTLKVSRTQAEVSEEEDEDDSDYVEY